MYLKKLELVGFKSFSQKTELLFEPGITAVVGPNGCGKSNIFDSIRWVLGEQSVKSLRGTDMQDVIFNGTDSKEPLSMAEVSLTFDNSTKFFSVDHPEVMITRRIFRNGESEYLLNKNVVRLKDILDILMGTGIGAESYSLIAQGQIDLILSSKPEDRRLVFDEASGITKYKSQKKEAIRKLEDTEQNLLRVNDIITEVKRQIGSLERQANKARRYKEMFEEVKSKEVAAAIFQRLSILKEKNDLLFKLNELEKLESEISEAIKAQETKVSSQQVELKALESEILATKNEFMNLDNLMVREKQHIGLNQERIKEIDSSRAYLESQITQLKNKLSQDEQKLNGFKEEYAGLQNHITAKSTLLKEKETELGVLSSSIKISLDSIVQEKREILDLVTKIATLKNEIADSTAKEQLHLARQKRLKLEEIKVTDEQSSIEESLKNINLQVEELSAMQGELSIKMNIAKTDLESETRAINDVNADIEHLERKRLTLESHKEFIEKLRTKFEDISESMDAVIYLDKLPAERVNGLVVKIKDYVNLSDEDKAYLSNSSLKISGLAKPIDLDTQKINQTLEKIGQDIETFKGTKASKEARIAELNSVLAELEQKLRSQEIDLSNKKNASLTVLEQFSKIKEESEIVRLELSDVESELCGLKEKLINRKVSLEEMESKHRQAEEVIRREENNININSGLKEKVLIEIAQFKTELEGFTKRVNSEEATLKILEEACRLDHENLSSTERQIQDSVVKKNLLSSEIEALGTKIVQTAELIEEKKKYLAEKEEYCRNMSADAGSFALKIEADKKQLDEVKNKAYDLQMENKDIDYKLLGIKERMLQNYKVDLDVVENPLPEVDGNLLVEEISQLKAKLDSLGTVNLVAIEEYDELKKRYDFLVQQQTDLTSAKDALHEAILKVNRTTRKMFLETFELVRQEFRGYFRLLFNGGDAQIFLVDENDPLESGIEIICRPPGKKLQNVLLLSGGEKALSAAALIFAIFKVKPSPFCVLDEIDAALDEANVDRFGRMLHEFSGTSQFIVITHNKRTIANASVMYGITMAESGVSKIVSVKFAPNKVVKETKAEAVAEPV